MIHVQGNNLVVNTPYNAAFVSELKASIPGHARKYNPENRTWQVTNQFGAVVKKLILSHFGKEIDIPQVACISEQRILDIRYIGMTKERGGSERAAYGWNNGMWSVILPEAVLRSWFCAGPAVPGVQQTYYAVLGISQNVNDDEIKRAFRRVAKQWHPDVCKEQDATEVFQRIQQAYEILSNENKRARYDAGLVVEEMIKHPVDTFETQDGYRAPLRCGLLYAEGHSVLDKFAISKIMAWADIVNDQGLTLISTWKPGADIFTEEWSLV
jgi:hypothetical protein